jgi:hypothetical protein
MIERMTELLKKRVIDVPEHRTLWKAPDRYGKKRRSFNGFYLETTKRTLCDGARACADVFRVHWMQQRNAHVVIKMARMPASGATTVLVLKKRRNLEGPQGRMIIALDGTAHKYSTKEEIVRAMNGNTKAFPKFPHLADRCTYLANESTMYRMLTTSMAQSEPEHETPNNVCATKPNAM